MRRKDHERIVHEKDRTIARIEQQNRELLDKLLYVTGNTWTPPPVPDLPDEPPPPYEWSPEQTLDAGDGMDDELLPRFPNVTG